MQRNARMPIESAPKGSERDIRIRQIVENCIERRAAGETVSDESLFSAHPDLTPELEVALRGIRLAQAAQLAAEQPSLRGLQIRCPHCQNPIELCDEPSFSDLICPECGSQFSLTDNSEEAFRVSPKEMVNHFQLQERVGVGAFGSVWKARDTQLDRMVALKIPRKGRMGPEDQEQFIREARAIAQLKHPGIVRVLEVGRFKDRVYLACEYIEGVDLARWLTERRATPREAAELCIAVADSLHHAHQCGVIHRDLKPSNIILDGSGQPHLMDFGLAKRETGEVTITLDGKLLGTPAYMSPEQARGSAHDADARSDIYSLGVVLFELLTGDRPFRGTTRMLLQQVLVDDAPSPRKLNRNVPLDLGTICLRCLEKDPSHRYRSAKELRDDLLRFLDGQPVRARPITRSDRMWRWCKRNPVVSGLVATVAFLLMFVAVASVIVAAKQRQLASAAKQAARESRQSLAQQYLHRGRTECETGFVNQGLHWFARALNALPPEDEKLRSVVTENLGDWSSLAFSPTAIFHHEYGISNIGYSPDDTKIVTLTFGGEAKLWSADSGELLHELPRHSDGLFSFAFSPDSRRLLTAGNGPIARLASVETGEVLARFEHEDAKSVTGVAFSSDGSVLTTVASDGVRRWSADTFELISRAEFNQDSGACALFSADGSLALLTGDNGLTQIWSVERDEPIGDPAERGRPKARAFSPDGSLLVTGSSSGEVKLWSMQNGELLWKQEHYGGILHVAFDSRGALVLTTSSDGSARIWSAKNGEPRTVPLQHGCPVLSGAFHPDGDSFVTLDYRAFIRRWSTKTGQLSNYPARFDSYANLAYTKIVFRPDGGRLVVSPCGLVAFELDRSDLQRVTPSCHFDYPPENRGGTTGVGVSPDGKRAITVQWSGAMTLWSLETGRSLGVPLVYERIWGITVSPTQPLAIAACGFLADTRRVVSFATGQLEEVSLLTSAKGPVVFSPDGQLVVTGAVDQTVRVWSTATWKEVMPPLALPARMKHAAFHPGGKLVAVLFVDGIVRFWSPVTGKFDGTTLRHPLADVVVMSPDGGQIATGGSDKQVITWDFSTRKPTGIVLEHRGPVTSVGYSPDAKRILTATQDGNVSMWSASTGERIGPPVVERNTVAAVAFERKRNRLLIGNDSGADLWDFQPRSSAPSENTDIWVRSLTGRRMKSSGTLEWLDRPTWLAARQQAEK